MELAFLSVFKSQSWSFWAIKSRKTGHLNSGISFDVETQRYNPFFRNLPFCPCRFSLTTAAPHHRPPWNFHAFILPPHFSHWWGIKRQIYVINECRVDCGKNWFEGLAKMAFKLWRLSSVRSEKNPPNIEINWNCGEVSLANFRIKIDFDLSFHRLELEVMTTLEVIDFLSFFNKIDDPISGESSYLHNEKFENLLGCKVNNRLSWISICGS